MGISARNTIRILGVVINFSIITHTGPAPGAIGHPDVAIDPYNHHLKKPIRSKAGRSSVGSSQVNPGAGL